MARIFNKLTLHVLETVAKRPEISPRELWETCKHECPYKELYNTVFRLSELELISKEKISGVLTLTITEDGQKALSRRKPERDGVWKLVIFDIPEKKKYVRTVLRAKLKSLGFKKWQNSIWVSPYALDEEIEGEMKQLSKTFFVRLIKTTDINESADLERMFDNP